MAASFPRQQGLSPGLQSYSYAVLRNHRQVSGHVVAMARVQNDSVLSRDHCHNNGQLLHRKVHSNANARSAAKWNMGTDRSLILLMLRAKPLRIESLRLLPETGMPVQ